MSDSDRKIVTFRNLAEKKMILQDSVLPENGLSGKICQKNGHLAESVRRMGILQDSGKKMGILLRGKILNKRKEFVPVKLPISWLKISNLLKIFSQKIISSTVIESI